MFSAACGVCWLVRFFLMSWSWLKIYSIALSKPFRSLSSTTPRLYFCTSMAFPISWPGIASIITIGRRLFTHSMTVAPPAFVSIMSAPWISVCISFVQPVMRVGQGHLTVPRFFRSLSFEQAQTSICRFLSELF